MGGGREDGYVKAFHSVFALAPCRIRMPLDLTVGRHPLETSEGKTDDGNRRIRHRPLLVGGEKKNGVRTATPSRILRDGRSM